MSDEPLVQQLAILRRLLDKFDARLTQAAVGLDDLKSSVDTLRTNMWAILSAGQGMLAHVRVERLKLRRAIEGLRSLGSSRAP
jgi:hypothetical protein